MNRSASLPAIEPSRWHDVSPSGGVLITRCAQFLPSLSSRSFRKNIMTFKSLKIAQFQPMSCPREGQQAGNMRGAQRSSFCQYSTAYPLNGSSIDAPPTAAPTGNQSHYLWHITHSQVISSCSKGSQSRSCLYHYICYSMALPS